MFEDTHSQPSLKLTSPNAIEVVDNEVEIFESNNWLANQYPTTFNNPNHKSEKWSSHGGGSNMASVHSEKPQMSVLSEASFYEPLHPGFPEGDPSKEYSPMELNLNINGPAHSASESPMEVDLCHSVSHNQASIIELRSEDTQTS